LKSIIYYWIKHTVGQLKTYFKICMGVQIGNYALNVKNIFIIYNMTYYKKY